MPLSNLLKSAARACPFCHQWAGVISREYRQCRRIHDAGFQETVNLAADAVKTHTFDGKSLRLSLRPLPTGRGRAVPTG